MEATEIARLDRLAEHLEDAAEAVERAHSALYEDRRIDAFGDQKIDAEEREGILALPVLKDLADMRRWLSAEALKVRDRMNNDDSEPPF